MDADQPSAPHSSEVGRQQTLEDLHELVDALDRRVPQPTRPEERTIADASARLKRDAEKRIAELESPSAS
jgi:hypothetical protein